MYKLTSVRDYKQKIIQEKSHILVSQKFTQTAVIPAKAGNQSLFTGKFLPQFCISFPYPSQEDYEVLPYQKPHRSKAWLPAFAGMTPWERLSSQYEGLSNPELRLN